MAVGGGSYLTVQELYRESYERVGVPLASLTIDLLTTARNTANFLLSSWTARNAFSWLRQRRFLNLTPNQFCYRIPAGVKQLESVVWTQPQVIPLIGGKVVCSAVPPDIEAKCSSLFTSIDYAAVTLPKATEAATPYIGWQYLEPVSLSYIGIVPEQQDTILAYTIQYQLTDGGDWVDLEAVDPAEYNIEPVSWHTIQAPIYAKSWRLLFHREPTIANRTINANPEVILRHIYFLKVPPNNVSVNTSAYPINNQGVADRTETNQKTYFSGDRLLGEIAYADWMAINQKMQSTSQPTAYFFNNQKHPTINIWPVPNFTVESSALPISIPGILYTAYYPPDDIDKLFSVIEVPATFIDALAAELAYRLCVKIKPEDQGRLQVLAQDAQNSFQNALNADAQASGFNFNITPDFSNLKR